ncbi:MAG TPA: ABC transporter substrate-binding protein [Candidatus Limnocylindria bacterium]|nr:ABC transporter substrate-binding protein [Candidatus Limnocylindria bacterium]
MKKALALLLLVTLCIAFLPSSLAEQGPIIIGGITDLTGPGSVLGKACDNGWKLAVEHINAQGGVLGRQLKLVSYDTQSNPQEALAAFERLVNVDKASIVVGPPFSNIGLALADTVDELKVAFFGQFGDPRCMLGENLDSLHPYMFLVQPSAIDTGILSGAYPNEKFGLTKVAMLIAQDHAYCSTQAKAFMQYAKDNGIEITTVQYCTTKDTDLTVQLTAIKNSGAQYLFNALNTNVLAISVMQMHQMGIDPLQCGSLDFSNPFNTLIDPPEAASNIYFPVNLDMGAPEIADITAEYTAKFGAPPTPKSWIAYDTVTVSAAAIAKAGSADPVAIRDALETISGVDTLITDNFSINPETHMPLNLQMCIYNLEKGVYTNLGWYYPAN